MLSTSTPKRIFWFKSLILTAVSYLTVNLTRMEAMKLIVLSPYYDANWSRESSFSSKSTGVLRPYLSVRPGRKLPRSSVVSWIGRF
jgi:hypothetical protein